MRCGTRVDMAVKGIGDTAHMPADAKSSSIQIDGQRIAHLRDARAVEVEALSRRSMRRRRCGNEAGGWSCELLLSREQKIYDDRRVMLGQGAHHVAAQGVRFLHRERRMVSFEEDVDDGVNGLRDADIDLARLDASQRLTNDGGDRRNDLVRRSPVQERHERPAGHAHREADRD
jgi:hypothetical protein